ncbi:MAG TPA: hypothetical protein VIN06_00515 [Devosia sp.]
MVNTVQQPFKYRDLSGARKTNSIRSTMLRASFFVLAIAASTPAFADAATYWGKLGKSDIVVELSTEFENADASVVGRYFYAKKGIDIPLRATDIGNGELLLFEELPCTPKLCEPAFGTDALLDELRGTVWTLRSDDGGHHLTGTWGDKQLPIELDLFGSRPVDMQPPFAPFYLADLPYEIVEGKVELTAENRPYEYLKSSSVDPTSSDDITENGVTYRYLTDPRSEFPFPQVASFGDSVENVVAANRRLLTRRAAMTNSALDCEARAYFGMGWMPGAENWLGSYGSYPDEQIEVTYISPTVMSWQESGSLYCGGAYPENHAYLTTIDMKTGEDLDKSRIFADSKMGEYRWEAGQTLIDLAISRRHKWDAEFEESCGMDELIASNLDVTFKRGDIAVFTLQGLPHVIHACQEDIFEAPLTELRNYLAPTAADYFPSLR